MNPTDPEQCRRHRRLRLVTALVAWSVTVVTLALFVAITLPLQRRTLLEQLESRARGVAVALRSVSAGAVVQQDFSAVVDHATQILRADEALEFLVIAQRGGQQTILVDRNSFRVEKDPEGRWSSARPEPAGAFGVAPGSGRRVYLCHVPLEVSGIQWGWIHAGLSPADFDRRLAGIWWRTGALAVVCLALSLVVSLWFAGRLAAPLFDSESATAGAEPGIGGQA